VPRRRATDVAVAALAAAIVSGAPSTAYALARGRDPLEATLAAGSLLLPREARRERLLAAALPLHLALSLAWALALARILPPRAGAARGALAGIAIAALDLGLVGRRFARVRALPLGPQLADHALYGVAVAHVLGRRG
jgi:hypothetical protein